MKSDYFDMELYVSLNENEKIEVRKLLLKFRRTLLNDEENLVNEFYKHPYFIEENIDLEYLKKLFNEISLDTNYKDNFIFHFISENEKLEITKYDKSKNIRKEYNLIQSKVALYNKQLKLINEFFLDNSNKISTPITSHLARHTYTSVLLLMGADVNIISKSLAHSSLSMTQNYIKTFENDTSVGDHNKQLFDKMKLFDKKIVEEHRNSKLM